MPVRLRITLLFTVVVFLILVLVCGSIYYVSYINRLNDIKTRLKNRAITTARLLGQAEMFPQEILLKIDASTALNAKEKIVQAYNSHNQKIYSYSDVTDDTLTISDRILDESRIKPFIYLAIKRKEIVVYHYVNNTNRMVVVSAAYDEDGIKKLRQLQLILWLSFAGGVLIAFAGGYIFSKRLLTPIRKISDEVNEISAQNLTRRIISSRVKDEWYYLADTLNSLLDRLQESFDTQRRFISNASHELCTPLTSISSQLEVSLQREREAGEYRQVMASIYQDVRHLSKLTQTLLEFAKASGDAGGLIISQIRIDEILLSIPADVKRLNSDYRVSLRFDNLPLEGESLLIHGNEDLLFSAIKNLIVNACKYSQDNLAIVKLSIKSGRIIIEVQDQGIGIARAEQQTIFQPFYRSQTVKVEKGFGLGLSLASRIIKFHKGELKMASLPGQGSVFTIILPSLVTKEGA